MQEILAGSIAATQHSFDDEKGGGGREGEGEGGEQQPGNGS